MIHSDPYLSDSIKAFRTFYIITASLYLLLSIVIQDEWKISLSYLSICKFLSFSSSFIFLNCDLERDNQKVVNGDEDENEDKDAGLTHEENWK